MKLLARTEGIFAETAGGVTLACAIRLIKSGQLKREGTTVLCITGNGMKTKEALDGQVDNPSRIKPNMKSFEEALSVIQAR